MNNGDIPAFANTCDPQTAGFLKEFDVTTENLARFNKGLTKREHFAAMAMQGLAAHPQGRAGDWDALALDSVKAADALLKALTTDKE